MTQPLPPINDDPAIVAARLVVPAYSEQVSTIRRNFAITDVVKAQLVVDAYEAANAELVRLYQDLRSRQQARIDVLATTVPIGPNIPENASPADKAVMLQAWRAAHAQAREATWPELSTMFDDALRFDDDTMLRAAITVAMDENRGDLVDQWAEQTGQATQLTELRALREAIAGRGFDNLTVSMAFVPPPKPPELDDLPRIVAAIQAAEQAVGRRNTEAALARQNFR